MIDPKTRFRNMIRKLKEGAYRVTPQRIAILKILSESTSHPPVEHIYMQVKNDFPTTSMATVYKTIIVLKELGEVLEIGLGDGSNRYDGNNPHPHPHLICVKCKKIVDADLDMSDSLAEELAKRAGYEIVNYRLDFFGICPECQ